MTRLLVLAALLYGTSAMAETPPTGTGTPTPTTPGNQPAPTQPGTMQGQIDDGDVAAVLMAANDIDVKAGELARTRSTNTDVKAFAERMVNEHGAVNKRLQDLNQRLGLKPDEGDSAKRLRADADAAMTRMRGLKGAEFDRAYIDNEVTFHTRVLEVIDTQLLPNVSNTDLKALVNEVRPNIQAHLTQARQIQQKLKAPS
ncbi:MAG: DUF4142 domain-containing protein [Myxococcota bacterium]